METRFRKLYGNWQGRTDVDINDKNLLRIETYKHSNGKHLVTHAKAWYKVPDGGLMHLYCVAGVTVDFSECLRSIPIARVTEKAVQAQHNDVLANIDALLEKARSFFAKPVGTAFTREELVCTA